jgi:hypothetical protein
LLAAAPLVAGVIGGTIVRSPEEAIVMTAGVVGRPNQSRLPSGGSARDIVGIAAEAGTGGWTADSLLSPKMSSYADSDRRGWRSAGGVAIGGGGAVAFVGGGSGGEGTTAVVDAAGGGVGKGGEGAVVVAIDGGGGGAPLIFADAASLLISIAGGAGGGGGGLSIDALFSGGATARIISAKPLKASKTSLILSS